MVETTKNSVKKQAATPTPTSLVTSSITNSEIKTKVLSLVELQQALLTDISLDQRNVSTPLGQKDTVEGLIQQLKSAINEESSRKAQEI